MNDKFGVVSGHIETVHSFTNDQNLIDNFHSGERRGRSASLNMVLTETVLQSRCKALPELAGKLTGNSIRVPYAKCFHGDRPELRKEHRQRSAQYLSKEMALNSALSAQIDYTESTEIVSSDLVGSRYAGVVDGAATIAQDNRCVLYVWYDNEFGYSCQWFIVWNRWWIVRYKTYPQK